MRVQRRSWLAICAVSFASACTCSPFDGYELRNDSGIRDGEVDANDGGMDAGDAHVDGSGFDGNGFDANDGRVTDDGDAGDAGDAGQTGEPPITDSTPVRFATVTPDNASALDSLMFRLTADGGLDPSFDDDGRLVDAQNQAQSAMAVARVTVGSSDRYLVFGDGQDALATRPIEARIGRRLGHGPVDEDFTFGLALPLDTSSTVKRAVDVEVADGRAFVLANASPSGANPYAFMRAIDNASYVSDFGDDGTFTLHVDDSNDTVMTDLAVASDGALLIAGTAHATAFVARVQPNGTLDETFANDGIAMLMLGANEGTRGTIVAATPTGSIAVRSIWSDNRRRIAVNRVTHHGATTLFGFLGTAVFDISDALRDEASAIVAESDDRFYVAGHKVVTSGGMHVARVIVMRMVGDGTHDHAFADDGVFVLSVPDAIEYWVARSIALASDGRVIIGGTVTLSDGRQRMVIARLTDRGELDDTFGDHGITLIDFISHDSELSRFILDDQERIIGVGWGVARAAQ